MRHGRCNEVGHPGETLATSKPGGAHEPLRREAFVLEPLRHPLSNEMTPAYFEGARDLPARPRARVATLVAGRFGTRLEDGAVVLASVALIAWASSPAARWLVDDAGISYAYGMNWGQHGELAPNLDGMRVEGFSNPLTVLLVAALSAVHCFHPLTTHRYLEVGFFALQALFAFRLLRAVFGGPRWIAWGGVALFLALEVYTPATLIWYRSGLENGQLSAALLVLLWRMEVAAAKPFRPIVDGTLLFVMALVRVEAALFVPTWLAVATFLEVRDRRRGNVGVRRGRALVWTGAVAVSLLLAAGLIRLAFFGVLLPNTVYAKVDALNVRHNFVEYVRPALWTYRGCFGLSLSMLALFASPRTERLAVALLGFTAASLALPLAAGGDWMGQHRFATSFLMLGHLSFAGATCMVWAAASRGRWADALWRIVPGFGLAGAVMALYADGREEYRAFLRSKYVGFAMIADVEGFERVRVQRYLGLIDPVVALPDVGGSAVVGDFQLVDTAYLADYHMARLRRDESLVRQYERDERRVDLAEYHGWAFDKSLVGTDYLPVAHFNAEEDYPNFWPAYAVRRDLVETSEPGPGSIRLGERGGLEAYLSGHTVLVGAPDGILRVEVLLGTRGGAWDPDCEVRVSLEASAEQRKVFYLSPLADKPFEPTPGRYYRHGFLLTLPSRPGDYGLNVELCAGGDARPVDARVTVAVRAPASLANAELAAQMGEGGSWAADAGWVAQLKEQLVARLSTTERLRLTERFRASYRDAHRTDVAAYDALVEDSQPAFLRPAPAAVRALEDQVLRAAASRALQRWNEGAAAVGARTLSIGRVIDDLRRFGFLDRTREGILRSVRRDVERGGDSPKDPVDAYARALGLALLVPQNARYQELLEERRVAGGVLVEVGP